jgi:polar amino acid transport system substrate-binding protein
LSQTQAHRSKWAKGWTGPIVAGILGGVMSYSMVLSPSARAEAQAAETVLEKITRTRKLVAGARVNTLPFSDYTDSEWRGYAIELMQRIQADLQRQLRHPVELEIKEVSIHERTAQLTTGSVDIICDATSFARSRDLEVDFSVGYFQTGTQLLFNTAVETSERVRAAYADNALIIGVMSQSTNRVVIERRLRIAQFIEFPNRAAGWTALQQGRIDALASDGILLEAMQQSSPSPENYVLVPARPYDQEIYACMLPPDQPAFQALVNTSLINFMRGVLDCQPNDLNLVNRWFGETGIPTDRRPLWELFQRQVNGAQVNGTQANLAQAGDAEIQRSATSMAAAGSLPAQCLE